MGNSSTKRHFETAQKTGVINLSQGGLKEFPEQMETLKSVLRTLDISHNKFSKLPVDIIDYTLLKLLNFDHNKIESIPVDFGKLIKLETISGNYNMLSELPRSLSQLNCLKKLSLSHNVLKEFPIMLINLPHLEVLDLSHNKIKNIPDGVNNMKIAELDLNRNQISDISPDIAKCSRLRILRLEENCLSITSIPIELLTQSNVSTLSVEGNMFEMKTFQNLEGYNQYMERYTDVKKKMF